MPLRGQLSDLLHAPRPAVSSTILPFVALVFAYFGYDYLSYHAPAAVGRAAVFAMVAGIVAVGILHLRWAFILFTIALVFADDISRLDPSGGELRSLLTVPVAGVSVVNLLAMALVMLGVFFWAMARSRDPGSFRPNHADAYILGILAVYGLATLHGYSWWWRNPRGVINDLNLPIMLAGLYFLGRWCLKTPGQLAGYWKWLLMASGAKAFGWLIFFLLGVGFTFGATLRVSNESGKVLMVLLFAWAVVLQHGRVPARRRERLLGLVWMGAAGVALLIQSQRGLWLMAAYAFVVLLLFGGLRDKVRWLMAAGVASIVAFAAVSYWMPDAFQTIRYRASTMMFWKPENFSVSTSNVVRVYEFINIHAQLVDRDNLILGGGPGATFSDNYYQFPVGIFTSEYSWAEIEKREFQNPHGLLQNLMLNVGYGGTLVYLGLIAVLYWGCFRLVRQSRAGYHRAVALALLAFLPTMVYNSWSPKNNMLLGLLLGVLGCVWQLERGRVRAERKAVAESGPLADDGGAQATHA